MIGELVRATLALVLHVRSARTHSESANIPNEPPKHYGPGNHRPNAISTFLSSYVPIVRPVSHAYPAPPLTHVLSAVFPLAHIRVQAHSSDEDDQVRGYGFLPGRRQRGRTEGPGILEHMEAHFGMVAGQLKCMYGVKENQVRLIKILPLFNLTLSSPRTVSEL